MGGGPLDAAESRADISPTMQLTESIDLSPLQLPEPSSLTSPAPALPERSESGSSSDDSCTSDCSRCVQSSAMDSSGHEMLASDSDSSPSHLNTGLSGDRRKIPAGIYPFTLQHPFDEKQL